METKVVLILSFTIYKLTSLFVAVIFMYFGYRLFLTGIWGSSGSLEGEFKDMKILMRKAAPGTFFALFGASIAIFTLLQGFDFYYNFQGEALGTTAPSLP